MKNFDKISILSEVMQAITLVHENKPLQKDFKRINKILDTELRLKLCRKVLNKTSHVRYLRIQSYENLNWKKPHAHDLAAKLNRANPVLCRLRHFVIRKILRSVCFSIF